MPLAEVFPQDLYLALSNHNQLPLDASPSVPVADCRFFSS